MNQVRLSANSPQAAPAIVDAASTAIQTTTSTLPKLDASPHYAVQLGTSAVPIDPRSVPRLDIFDLYTLYCDVRMENGSVRHALRLGFFKEAPTAKMIARYLASYFDAPEIVELAAAEQTRALRLKLVALKDVGDSGRHATIELAAPPPVPAESPAVPVASPSGVPVTSTRTPKVPPRSLWSRLVETKHR
jgi:hypothetical protein